ncbi:MAG TPA: hypothetical protein VJ767_08955 [Nitrososphaeraceae archaeon]|nr:hypothetical protein [Nitrososphaeraceae archaeon]
MSDKWTLEKQHKALLFSASIAVKSFLMATISSNIFCKSIDPNILFLHCSMNIVYVGLSTGAIIVMGTIFGYYIIRLKTFDNIFANMMKSDYIITTMYFSMGFLAPATMSTIILIWLFGIWILGMLLAPFNKEKTILKKVTQYGSLVAVGILLVASLIPQLHEYGQPFAIGAIISSLMSIFGAGRVQS